MKPLEHAKHDFPILIGNPDAVVGNRYVRFLATNKRLKTNDRPALFGMELQRVRQQVHEQSL
jgi:hypothetical protein